MNAFVGQCRSALALLVLAAGMLFAAAGLARAESPSVQPRHAAVEVHYALSRLPHLEGVADSTCAATGCTADCTSCCLDMGGAGCCAPVAACNGEAMRPMFDDNANARGFWFAPELASLSPQVAKRPPRLAA